MIPAMNIIAWSKTAPWAEQRQVEQDLIISRAIVELFSDKFLAAELRFRGALNKLHFPKPLRYPEDIDLVRTTKGPIKPVLRRVREVLEPWLGEAALEQSPVSPKLIFRADAEDGGVPLRLKVEIAIWETETYAGSAHVDYAVDNPHTTVRGAAQLQERVHFIGFVNERTYGAAQFAEATRFIANPASFSNREECTQWRLKSGNGA